MGKARSVRTPRQGRALQCTAYRLKGERKRTQERREDRTQRKAEAEQSSTLYRKKKAEQAVTGKNRGEGGRVEKAQEPKSALVTGLMPLPKVFHEVRGNIALMHPTRIGPDALNVPNLLRLVIHAMEEFVDRAVLLVEVLESFLMGLEDLGGD